MNLRFLPAGEAAILVETGDLETMLALLAHLQAPEGHRAFPEIAETIPGAQSLMLRLDGRPSPARRDAICAALGALDLRTAPPSSHQPEIRIEVSYDGEDLAEVAELMGVSVPDLITAHQAAHWQVAFTGFAPGFAYLVCDDPRFDLPRRASPRPRIPAGAVALGGRFSGIYPQASPGGWQLIGRTDAVMFDPERSPAALLQPGSRVSFTEARRPLVKPVPARPPDRSTGPGLRIIDSAFPVLIQDLGREGRAHAGLSPSGAMDRNSLIRANRRLGNPPTEAALELMPGPLRLLAERSLVLAHDGAHRSLARLHQGRTETLAPDQPIHLAPGDQLLIGAPEAGVYGYLALQGGIEVEEVMGSRARDSLAGLGPAPFLKGARIAAAGRALISPTPREDRAPTPLGRPHQTATLRITQGPRADWFAPEIAARLTDQSWSVTSEISRSGIRINAPSPLTRAPRELPSEATLRGAIQVPHSGQPVIFMADHPVTGGYPVIALVINADLDRLAQLPPGARIRFTFA